MASDLHIVAVDATPDQIAAAVRRVEHLEQMWSRFLPGSDISRLNRSAGRMVYVDEATTVLVRSMIEGWRASDGRFDAGILPAIVEAGYAVSRDDPTHRTQVPAGATLRSAAMEEIELDDDPSRVMLPVGLALDPGGLGKGLAADLVVGQLIAGGASGALVAIGGDLAMAGRAPHPDGWLIAVEHPDPTAGVWCTLAVDGGGIATSSTTSRRWTRNGTEHHHAIDPSTGRPSGTDLATVTVVAPTGWQAEVHATAALGCGTDGVLDYLADRGLTGLGAGRAGDRFATPDLAALGIGAPVVVA